MAGLTVMAGSSIARNAGAELRKAVPLGEKEFLDAIMPEKQRNNDTKAGELSRAYKDHLKFEHSGHTIVSLKSSPDFYKLRSDKSGWDKISTETDDKLTNDANSKLLSELVQLKAGEKEVVSSKVTATPNASGKELSENGSNQFNNLSLPKVAEQTYDPLIGSLINLLPSAETTKAAVGTAVYNQIVKKANNKLLTNPNDALDFLKMGANLYHSVIENAGVATSKDREDTNLTVAMMDYSKELLGKPIDDKDIPRIRSMISELNHYYSADRVEAFREAMDTGLINGKEISREKAKFHFDGGQILNAIKEGKYNTPEGKLSEYGFDMVHTLKYGELEKDLKQWF